MTESSCMCCVMTDNEYIVKLIKIIKIIITINKKQQQFTAAFIYAATLQKSFSA